MFLRKEAKVYTPFTPLKVNSRRRYEYENLDNPMQKIQICIGLLKLLLTQAKLSTMIYTNLCKTNKNADVCIKGGG